MKKSHLVLPIAVTISVIQACATRPDTVHHHLPIAMMDSLLLDGKVLTVWNVMDTIKVDQVPQIKLTQKDYEEVAAELGVEVAAIKAVVEIEAGVSHNGFWSEGKPIINFDLTMYNTAARRNGVDLAKARKSAPVIFRAPDSKKYGSQQAGQQARLDAAMAIDSISAIDGTFWGMFQIGGFNWKRCGASDRTDFVKRMSTSEREQLELFAGFIKNTDLVKPLKAKDWASFARGYNGASYARRGYHTRMANAYRRYKEEGKTK